MDVGVNQAREDKLVGNICFFVDSANYAVAYFKPSFEELPVYYICNGSLDDEIVIHFLKIHQSCHKIHQEIMDARATEMFHCVFFSL
ncbi:MAG: hypothetical protein KKE97_09135 [Proteobacteria bacterium]|jgi:hypothetical protein|nr:hypothetical protein [Pseudomonadota bacterium]